MYNLFVTYQSDARQKSQVQIYAAHQFKKGGFKIGDYLEKHRLIKVLHKNDFSAVVLVENEKLSCKRIIKIISKNHPNYDSLIKEAKILQNFRCLAIPIIYDIFEEETEAYLEEEYIEGESLKNYLKRQSCFKFSELLTLSIQLCDILIYIHKPDRRVYHLDIKPENILVSDNQLKLVDFGSAICERDQKDSKALFGTPGFCAPEQINGGEISVLTDIYAMGRTFKYAEMYVHEPIPKSYRQIVDNCLRKGTKLYEDALQIKEELLQINTRSSNTLKERWIAVVGIPTDYNSSTYALLMALKKAKRKKVLLLDCNEAHNLAADTGLYTDLDEKKLTFVPKVLPQELPGFRGRGYDTVICDFGNGSPFSCDTCFDEVILVGELTPWTINQWKEKLLKPDKNMKIKVVAEQCFDFRDYEFKNLKVHYINKKYGRALNL